MSTGRTETEIACEIVKLLDGLPIDLATNALNHAILLLSSTQVVSAKSPLLMAKAETALAISKKL